MPDLPRPATLPRPAALADLLPDLEERYRGDRPVRTLVRMFRGQGRRLAVAALAFVVKHSPIWVMPLLTAQVVDIVVQRRPRSQLALAGAAMAVLVLQNYPMHQLYVRSLSVAVRTVETGLRSMLCRRLQELSIGYHRRVSTGTLQTKIIRDVENVVESVRQSVDSGMAALSTLLGALVVTGVRVPQFLPVFAVVVPASAALLAAVRRRMGERNAAYRTQVERMSARVTEMAQLVPITRAHALESRELERMDGTLVGVRDAGIRLDVVNGRFGALAWIMFQLLSIGCLVGAAWVAASGGFGVTAGDVVLLSSYFVTLTGSVAALMSLAPVFARGLESVRSMGELLSVPDVERHEGKPRLASVRGTVEFDRVTYAYDGAGEAAVADLSLVVPPGRTVAFVGASGSGKSTVLNLVIGFLAPQSGRVLVDGHDLAGTDLRSYRRFVAVVPQESVLFEGSVRDNVAHGRPDLDDDAVRAALAAANALDFVTAMGGLDAPVGERGGRLSGGERQRLAIARALIRDPRVLVLDEATSALDGASERVVQEALDRLAAGRTTFVVAHRLATVRRAHRIVVLDGGRVVETGTHTELLAAGGRYARMHALGLGVAT